ncbi:MAG: hypothetical protein PHP45_09160 [Elusimicrobiales bacterium]|nr:hypothetical protein [Elusimicrobiales bacterium]
MKKLMLFGAALVFSTAAHAATDCYQLSADEGSFSRTPEVLCVTHLGQPPKNIEIVLAINDVGNIREIGILHLDLLKRVRCLDCNKDVYGVSNPSNSVFNKLAIEFDGKRDLSKGEESGMVKIGENLFHYRKIAPADKLNPTATKAFCDGMGCPLGMHCEQSGPASAVCVPD